MELERISNSKDYIEKMLQGFKQINASANVFIVAYNE